MIFNEEMLIKKNTKKTKNSKDYRWLHKWQMYTCLFGSHFHINISLLFTSISLLFFTENGMLTLHQ